MSTNQELASQGAAILERIELDMAAFADILSEAGDAPFADDKCNARFARHRRKWATLRRQIVDYHADLTECVQDGDVTVQFGGDK